MKTNVPLLLFFIFNSFLGFSQVYINEYSCSNLSSNIDNYGEYNDWIELANPGPIAVNIGDYYLSNSIAEPLKWKIPSGVSIPGNGFLVIWASGRNEFSNGNVHASFKLTQSKKNPDWIILSDAAGNLIEQVQIQRHQQGHSMGKVSGSWQINTNPSPGSANSGITKTRYASAPVFSKTPGFYANSFVVTLINTEPNSKIYYTKDGTNPATGGTQYFGGISIDSTQIIKAVTFSNNLNIFHSFITFGTFFINVNHSMAVISIAGNDLKTLANGNQSLRPEGSFELFDKNKILQATSYGNFNPYGQDSWTNDQRSLDYTTLDEMGYDDAIHKKLFSLSPRNEFQEVILWAAGNDNYPAAHHSNNYGSTHMRDAYVQNMSIQGGLDLDARTGEKAIVYLNGQYWGIYDMREPADNQEYTNFYYGQDKFNIQYLETSASTSALYGGNAALADWSALHTFIMNNDMSNAANYQYVTDNLDVKSLVDYAIVNSVTVSSDWLNYNAGWWRGLDPKGGHKKWGYTLINNDAIYGFYLNYTNIPTTNYYALPCNIENNRLIDPEGHIDMLIKLRENPTFNQFYISRYIDLLNTTYSCDNVLYNLDSIKNILSPEMTKHAGRWFGTYSEWNTNVATMRYYIANRCVILNNGLDTCYNLTGPYNTTFKTIPSNSGSIQVNSLVFNNLPYTGRYHGKIDVLLKAIPGKDFIFAYWTAGIDTFKTSTALLNSIVRIAGTDTIIAHFATRTVYPKLNITEINYNPEPTLNSGSWFELTNYSTNAIDISGWKIMQGKWRAYVFSAGSVINAGAHWILASDSARFNSIYKNTTFTKKYVAFNLSMNNEALKLIDTSGTEFLSVSYNNSQPWPIAADGAGRNMELKNDSLNCGDVANWRNGCVGGSPGASFQNCNEKFIVTEINYNPGPAIDAGTWFEILNTTNQSINLSGYSIRNKDFGNKSLLPSGTVLSANGRLVFCSDKQKFANYFPTQNVIELLNFSLDNAGDKILIYGPTDTLVFSVAFEDSLAFTSQADGTGYTLDYNNTNNDYSQGINWSIACLGGSPNRVKGNCISGIIFSEVNYQSAPYNDAGDWFEIKNKSSNTYNLKGWQFTDSTAGGFIVNNNYLLTPNAYLVLISDSVKFKKMYPNVTNFIGNMNFNLKSAGERINIYDSLNDLVSTLNYNDSLPWPGFIDGRGYTLELRYDTGDFHFGDKWLRGCLGGSPGALFSACSDSVIVSEINFNSHTKADAGDWIELWNKGAYDVDISRWLLQDNNINDTFLIPVNTILNAGARLVLVNDSSKFKTIFPAVRNFTGNFSFGLSSLADQIVIRDTNSKLKFGMAYTIDSTWDSLANGQGYTLELIKDSFDRSIGACWKSKCPGGSPGSASGACTENIIITEINYKSDPIFNTSDWFELFNNGTTPVNMSGHFIANNDSSVRTVIPVVPTLLFANEYFVLSNDTIALNKFYPGIKNKTQVNYSLKDTGDIIKIYDAIKNPVVSSVYSAAGLWPAMAGGKGFTLEKKNYNSPVNDYSNWDVGCIGGSPGTAKQNCKINLVISEINYNPQATEDDGQWIELKNVSLTDTIDLQSGYLYINSLSRKIQITKPVKLNPNSYFVIASDSVKFLKYHTINLSEALFNPLLVMNKPSDEISFYTGGDRKLYIARYNSSEPTLTLANGKGHTLEYIDTGKVFYDTKNWFTGCRHGSPGKAYGSCVVPILISEINYKSHPKFDMGKWIEIKNIANYTIDISGWILQNGTASQKLKLNLLLPKNSFFIVGDKIQSLKNNYNLNATLTDSLTLNLITTDIIKIMSGDSVPIIQTNYSNASNWPKADGTAYTLEYSDTAANKFTMGCPGGSPGSDKIPCIGNAEISEINYNSHQKNLSNDWIEIQNKNTIPFSTDQWNIKINDSNAYQVSDKFNLLFSGDKQVIVKSKTDFNKTHALINIMESTKLDLPDSQATLRIYTDDNILVDSVSYSSSGLWSPDANNTGRTLELINSIDNSNPANWIAGCIGGTPGSNYNSPCNYTVLVSEINYHQLPNYNTGDWAELHNTTNIPIDISNVGIKTKNSAAVIPTSTVIPAKGYIVIAQNKIQFATIFPNVNNVIELPAFQIADGDKIELYDNKGNITYYVNFDTLAPWPSNTMKGYTLEYADTATNPWIAGNWFRGCFAGTPGRSYSLPCDINGIAEKSILFSIRVFPNPNAGSFTVYTPFEGEATIYDMNGREVMHKYFVRGNNLVELKQSKGMYILTLFNGKELVKRKIVID
jgi:hypothetical protein